MRFPAEWYPKARSVKRKIIMHVGPTNSGKTYNALRALAAARSGVYAGPLRLLAHEVWERLNNGSISIMPISLLPEKTPSKRPVVAGHVTSSQGRNSASSTRRQGLVSCTIEMLPVHTFYDVAVIDEIQMLGDPERGLSWTHALLSVCASEVHLCGEATVVDLVRRIASETGDELVVNEYQRLTPLVVSPSLDGDLSLVTKGDCVVSFSRSKIFDLKQSIERKTGLKCAVAYGRLPPEVRSEQAQYFNDPESGFDVMVASDAVGMGLNLKIKRVIFSNMSKWNGKEIQALSVSQTKQIAGRAGRFGLHSTSTVGEVTTLMADELPRLRKAMNSVNPPISKAILLIDLDRLQVLYNTLPPGTGITGLYDVLDQLALPGTNYSPHGFFNFTAAAQFIDREVRGASFQECMKIMNSPTAWSEPAIAEVTSVFIQTYLRDISVDLSRILTQNGSMDALRTSQSLEKKDAMKLDATSLVSDDHSSGVVKSEKSKQERYQLLSVLELMHKTLGLYLWFSYRLPLGFSQQSLAFELKEEVERSIDYLLNTVISAKKRDRLDSEVAHLERSTAPKGFTWEQGAIAKSKAAHSIF
ncbi:hypothetical protein BS47DRAFT_1377270 [Hydnum rufescens UP504]|uniref:RNA helicase n=1 Tax=Hydnum rufescens UP504 TaxID=1448309 RepID=A0A9P6ATJ4_9AGAM|nr:hypothetical protein BS47DRAFT_1377270 [Hydnum rufescens UP504]